MDGRGGGRETERKGKEIKRETKQRGKALGRPPRARPAPTTRPSALGQNMVDLIWKHFKLPALDYDTLPEAPLARWRDLADRYDQLRETVRAVKCTPHARVAVSLIPIFFFCL